MPHNEGGASPCPDSDPRVGPPRCQWHHISVGWEQCYDRADISPRSTVILCDRHAKQTARSIGYVSRADSKRLAQQSVQGELDRLRVENARLHAAAEKPAKARARRDSDAAGTIYFLRSGAYFKIGWTSDLGQRMKGYPPDTQLLASQPGTKKDERAIHRRFSHLLGRGREWFVMAPEIEDHIARVVAEHGPAPVVDFTARRANRTAGRQKQYVGGPNRGSLATREVRG